MSNVKMRKIKAIGPDSTSALMRHQADEEEDIEEYRVSPATDSSSSSDAKLEINEATDKEKPPSRGAWDNKIQYILAQVGFAVGLGNVWRFPYLCQKNGGGAFLIPYLIMLVVEGVPLFYMEIAIGQRLKKGSVGVWNYIHPCLGGVGVASMVVCFFIALYYNMIIAWALFYFFNSFQQTLPWAQCPNITNTTEPVQECAISSSTSYFWYRATLDISPSISEPGNVVWRLSLVLIAAWLIVFIGMFKGIKSSGKMIYFSATFPYIVLLIYFFRGITLDGAIDGVAFMFTPNISRLTDPNVWRDAATQIFFSLGLGFGGVIAYSSYNDEHNNCKKDALTVALINCGTSIFSSLVIFSILGFKAFHRTQACIDGNIELIRGFFNEHQPDHCLSTAVSHMNRENYPNFVEVVNHTLIYQRNDTAQDGHLANLWQNLAISDCSAKTELNKTVSGPGLAFIAFTEAMIHLDASPFWSVMFFLMLINLGLGSMFGTLEGIITPLRDLGLKVPKEAIVGILCVLSLGIGQIFTLRCGMYILDIFDTYAGTLPLLTIAFFETIAVSWVYGFKKFSGDIEHMLGSAPGLYWKITWCFLSPACMFVLFVASIVKIIAETPQYKVYNKETGNGDELINYPGVAIAFIIILIFLSVLCIPVVAVVRWKKGGYRCKTNDFQSEIPSKTVEN